MALIALISDFSTRDWFVAEVKGVILSVSPDVSIVDITHNIAPGDIRSAAFVLYSSYASFPIDTIFCVAVDPGSNSDCPVIVTQTDCYTFVSPDNGVTSLALTTLEKKWTYKCTDSSYFRTSSPSTFRGRDIIAPIAAHCANKTALSLFGPLYEISTQLELPKAMHSNRTITSEIIYIDSFGNCITGIRNDEMFSCVSGAVSLTIAKKAMTIPVVYSYNGVTPGNYLLYKGSADYLEIAASGGSAADLLDVSIGDAVTVSLAT